MNRWEPRPLPEFREGSLLRSVGLSKRAAIWIQVVWFAIALASALARPADRDLSVIAWFFGALAIRFITARLGGRPAKYTPAGDKLIENDSLFEWRLLLDISMIGYLVLALLLMAIGRPFLVWLTSWN